MKRLFLLILGLGILGGLGWLGWNTWQTTRYFQENGRDATIVVGPRYNAARWAMPPLKKIHTYAARLEPKYDVLIETDQELKENDKLAIRFLTRDLAPDLLAFSARPVVNTMRLRTTEDGTPVKIEDSNLFDQLVDRAMGPPAEGVYVRPRAKAEAAPDRQKPTVPFVISESGDSTWAIIWKNSRAGEWLAVGFALLAAQSLLIAVADRQKAAARPDTTKKGFVHPSLRRVEADATAPSKKLTYVPKPDEEIVLPESEKRRATTVADAAAATSRGEETKPVPDPALAPLPLRRGVAAEAAEAARRQAEAPAPAPAAAPADTEPKIDETELPSLAKNETAPPMPIPQNDPVLKLRRK